MRKTETRNYNCKDEELSAICRNALFCLERDLPEFNDFSPIFNEDYVNKFREKISLVDELVLPKTETDELKRITKRLYETMDSLTDSVAKVRGYLLLAKSIGISTKDFGLTMLSRKISDRDAEGTRQYLSIVIAFIEKYREPLMDVGLSEAIIEQLNSAVVSITEYNHLQFSIVSKRKAIVQTNLSVLNGLHAQLMDILAVGKSLYKSVSPLKFKEYSFSSLKKSVRK